MKKIIFLIFLSIFFIFYFFTQKEKLTYSFYHWENNYKQKHINSKLYIKVLDIEYSNKIESIKTRFLTQPKDGFVPVVYITNKAMQEVSYKLLAKRVISSLKNIPYAFNEIQIDCDWSLSSKSNYFEMLKIIKEKLNKKLSATIRLHQIKYLKKTGVPPVDYGVLMYYNMSNIGDFESKNSILDNDIAKKYHYNFDIYPLKLKLALPLYSQAIQFRNKKPLDIFEGVSKDDFNDDFKALGKNRYEVINSFYFQGRYVYSGDIFRFENSNLKDLKVALDDFLYMSKNRFNEVIFYREKYKDKYNIKEILEGK